MFPRPIVLRSELLRDLRLDHGFSLRPLDLQRGRPIPPEFLGEVAPSRARLYTAVQVHGKGVFVVDPSGMPLDGAAHESPDAILEGVEADALVSSSGLQAVGIRTADCVPVLMAHREGGQVAAIHAGWRGVAAQIVPETVGRLDFSPTQWVAAIGPCIGACCYRVGADVAEAIRAASGRLAVREDERGEFRADLRLAVRLQLEKCGLFASSIEDVGGCTCCDSARFHSHRRDGALAGRMLAVIGARTLDHP